MARMCKTGNRQAMKSLNGKGNLTVQRVIKFDSLSFRSPLSAWPTDYWNHRNQ